MSSGNDEELQLLRRIDGRLDTIDSKLSDLERQAVKTGAVAGAVSGGLSGGLIALGIMLAKAKLGV